jgi:hypothetical protein
MYTGHWTRAELLDLFETLLSNHILDVRLEMLDLDHNGLGKIDHALVNGQVNFDLSGSNATRMLTADLLDPRGDLHLDKFNPSEGTMYMDRMIRCWYCVARMDGSKWYEIPLFTGPVTKVDRDEVMVSVEATGKEILANDTLLKGHTWKKGYVRNDLIRRILKLAGEQHFKIANLGSKTGSPTSVSKGQSATTPIGMAKKLANAGGAVAFYNGLGEFQSRRRNTRSMFTIDGKSIIESPQVGYDMTDFYNCVEVVGSKPKHAKKKVHYTARAPKSHPLSPQSLKRGGVPRYRVLKVEDDTLKTNRQCKETAKRLLKAGLVEKVDVSMAIVVLAMLEEYDNVKINTDQFVGKATYRTGTVPLVVGDGNVQSFGYTKSVKPARTIRRKHHVRKK